MANYNLTGQKIKDTYPQLAQVNDSNLLVDGLGVVSPILTSSIINFPTEVSRSAAAAGFGGGSLPSGVVSSSAQVVYSGITGVPSGIVSSSAQVSYSGITGVPSGIVSSSAQILPILTSSITNFPTEVSRSAAAAGFGAGGGSSFPYTGSAVISGSLVVSGSTFIKGYYSDGFSGANSTTFEVVTDGPGLGPQTAFRVINKDSSFGSPVLDIKAYQTLMGGGRVQVSTPGIGGYGLISAVQASASVGLIVGSDENYTGFILVQDNSVRVNQPFTASIVSASFVGNLTGNATTSTSATSASYAVSSSHALNVGLVSGGGVSSIKSADFLTATASVASNINTIAIGSNTRATGDDANAIGKNSLASALNSTAIGIGALASGNNSVAIGRASATSVNAFAFGDGSIASNSNTVAIGIATQASGNESVSIGTSHNASGDNSVAIGRRGACSGQGAVSIGSLTEATATDAIAIGASAQATTGSAIALGASVIANVPSYTTTRFLQLLNVSSSMGAFGFVDDTAAASGGVPLGGIYHLSGSIKIRMV